MSINFESRLISLNENLMSQQFLPISSFHFSRSKVITVSSLPHSLPTPIWFLLDPQPPSVTPPTYIPVYAAIMSFCF